MSQDPNRSLAFAVMLAASLVCSSSHAAWFGDAGRDKLTLQPGGYVLRRPFEDFYDTAFVLTNAGTSAPRVVSLPELADVLASYDVVFYGESHGHPGVHLQQMKLMRALYERRPQLVLSLEQFERDVQAVIDDYLAGRVGETALMHDGRAWGNYASAYRPLVTFAKDHDLPVIAAGAPTWAVNCVGQWGTEILSQFSPLERSWVAAELHLDGGPYRDKFMKFQADSPMHGGGADTPQATVRAERSFAAQITRDDTMAELIARAAQRYPHHQILHLTGAFHVAGFLGTVERLRLRDPSLKIAVIEAVEVADRRAPGFAPEERSAATALQLVYPAPESFAEREDMTAWVASMTAKTKSHSCKYSPQSPATLSVE
jgi:uncharacterized iron-regulated protein